MKRKICTTVVVLLLVTASTIVVAETATVENSFGTSYSRPEIEADNSGGIYVGEGDNVDSPSVTKFNQNGGVEWTKTVSGDLSLVSDMEYDESTDILYVAASDQGAGVTRIYAFTSSGNQIGQEIIGDYQGWSYGFDAYNGTVYLLDANENIAIYNQTLAHQNTISVSLSDSNEVGVVEYSPADDVYYLAINDWEPDGYVYRVESDGTLGWNHRYPNVAPTEIDVNRNNGNIAVVSEGDTTTNNKLTVFQPDGTLLGQRFTSRAFSVEYSEYSDLVYVAPFGRSTVYGLNPDTSTEWSISLSGNGWGVGTTTQSGFLTVYATDQNGNVYEISTNTDARSTYTVDGYITDANNQSKYLENVNISFVHNGSEYTNTTTNSQGYYSVNVPSQNYTVSLSRENYTSKNVSLSVPQHAITRNYTLQNISVKFDLRTPSFMAHGSTAPYVAMLDTGGYYLESVTQNTTVVSQNTTIITVNSSHNYLVATSNTSINARVNITATYTVDNKTYTDSETITVANRTIENINIMPPSQWVPSALGFGESGTVFGMGSEIQWIFVAIFTGASAAWISRNEWIGVGTIMGSILLFWVLDNVSLGIVMVAMFYGLFVAYQLNKIPSRSDTNVGGGINQEPPQEPPQL